MAWLEKWGWWLLIAAGLAFPLLASNDYLLTVMGKAFIFAIATLGLNLITGYTGQFNLAHAGFMAVGAYTVGILTVDHQVPYWIAFALAGVVTTVLGYFIGILSLRLRGHYFSIFTLCVGYIMFLVIEKWEGLTHGTVGIMGIPAPSLGFITFDSPLSLYYLALLFLVVGVWAMRRIVGSLLGRTFMAVRNSEELAEALGTNLMRTKTLSFMLSVFYAIVTTFALSFLRRDTALMPPKLKRALADGSIGALNAATTCASAGIVVGVVTLTGLGLKFSSIVISYAGGSLLLTAIYTALIVWIIGLAVPVTASYIICAVIAAPAMIKLGVPDYAAHMFIFYYAVLSEVSPPTALSPFAAAAITGGDPYMTTLQSWKYTLPAFLVPFVFVLDPQGAGLLLSIQKGGSWVDILEITFKTTLGLMALAAAAQGWALRRTSAIERALLALSGLLLVFPSLIEALVEAAIGRDISYTYVPGVLIGLGVLLWQAKGPAVQRPA